MPKTVFTEDDLAAWRTALEANKPEEISDESWETLEQIDSFRAQATNAGEVVRLRRKDGSVLDLILTPVAARHLAVSILKHGQTAGWLDGKGDLICPPARFDA